MGQFKPMVKMETTEPSVELKLKKGGCVTTAKKMAGGGKMGAPMGALSVGARGGMAPAARPGKPSMADRRGAMAGRPVSRLPMPPSAMAKGGAMDALEAHAAKPASKGHKGLKTGGVAKSPKPGNFATGGVVNGQAGFKSGGIIKSEKGKTMMHTAKVDTNSAPTGDVKLGNGGGYKKGGSAKKAYATGGAVNNSGHAVAMPKKPASSPVSNDRQSGTFKKGGTVNMKKGGSSQAALEKAYMDSIGPDKDDMDMAKTIRDIPGKIFRGAKRLVGMDDKPSAGSVTETEKSVTVEPAKKRGGSVKR